MANKKTQKELFEELKVLAQGNQELVEFLDKKIEQVSRKRATGLTATQKENEVTKELIVEKLTELAKKVTISELQETDKTLAGLSNQKVSALLKQLVDANVVIKTIEKKKAYFEIAQNKGTRVPFFCAAITDYVNLNRG